MTTVNLLWPKWAEEVVGLTPNEASNRGAHCFHLVIKAAWLKAEARKNSDNAALYRRLWGKRYGRRHTFH